MQKQKLGEGNLDVPARAFGRMRMSLDLVLPLLCAAAGASLIATEGLMLAGVLPTISSDRGASSAGQLLAVLALTFALGFPTLAVATGNVHRKRPRFSANESTKESGR